jgi:HSP20 family protein
MNDKNDRNEERVRVPACSIFGDEGLVTVKVEMPGVPKEGLEVKIDGNELLVRGDRPALSAEGNYLLRERSAFPYRKAFTIDETIDRDKVEASLADGILTLSLHVKEAAKPRRVEIA